MFFVFFLTLVFCSPAPQLWSQEKSDTEQQSSSSDEKPAKEKKAEIFRSTITVESAPIVQGSKLDPLSSLVTTVTEQQIKDLNAQDLTSALRRVPGVVISRYNPIGAFGGGDGGAFFIRGHGSGRPGGDVLMMTEGIPRFVGVWSHPLIDVANIDSVRKVDIYRSPQPVLVGNMAFGAVDMSTPRRMMPGSGGRVTASMGSFNTLVGDFEFGGRSKAVDYYLTAGHRQSDGHRKNADGEVTAASGRLGVRLNERWDLSMFYEHTASSVDDPGMVDAPSSPIVPNYDISNDFVLATVRHQDEERMGTLKFYIDDGTFDWLQWSSDEQHAFRSITGSKNYGVRWRESVTPWENGELIGGLDYDVYGGSFVERHPEEDRSNSDLEFRNTAPYLMLSHTFAGDVSITPSVGLRYNDSRFFGNTWGGQAGLTLGFGHHALYANWAHGFNLPGMYAAVQYGAWGRGDQWKDLKPETIDHSELGWIGSFADSIRLTTSIFHDEVEDSIRFVPPPPPPPLFANIGAYTVNGIEVSLQMEPVDDLALFLGATYSDADPETVPNVPRTTAVGGLAWTGPGEVKLNCDLQWVGERYVLNPRYASVQAEVDGYLLVNAKLDIPWPLLGLRAEGSLFLAGENLTNEAYEYRIGYPMPGRAVQAGFSFGF